MTTAVFKTDNRNNLQLVVKVARQLGIYVSYQKTAETPLSIIKSIHKKAKNTGTDDISYEDIDNAVANVRRKTMKEKREYA